MAVFNTGSITWTAANTSTANGTFTMPYNNLVAAYIKLPELADPPKPPLPVVAGERMTVGWRAWGVRRTIRTERRHRIAPRYDPTSWTFSDWQEEVGRAVAYDKIVEEIPVATSHRLVGLAGTPVESPWHPGLNTARCAGNGSLADHWGTPCVNPPAEHCQCGFWAAKTRQWTPVGNPTSLDTNILSSTGACDCRIQGIVGLSGTLEEQEHGWRASHARILALYRDPTLSRQPHHHSRWPTNTAVVSYGRRMSQSWHGNGFWYEEDEPAVAADELTAQELQETGDVHFGPLASHYRVPVFDDMAELSRYADRYHVTPGTILE